MPISVVVVSDFDIIVSGVQHVLSRFPDRVRTAGHSDPPCALDLVLWNGFGTSRSPDFVAICEQYRATRAVVLCWDLEPDLVDKALAAGASGYLSTRLTAEDLVAALERIHHGQIVVEPTLVPGGGILGSWPGRPQGLSEREADIVALIASGMSNDEIAGSLFLSINTVKSYIRSAYRKMDVRTRSEAVLWGIDHGLRHREVEVARDLA